VEKVTVGVGDGGVPEVIADERLFGVEAAGFELVVQRDGIVTLKPDGAAKSAFFGGDAMGIVFLEHESGAA